MMLGELATDSAWHEEGDGSAARQERRRSFWRPQPTIWERWPALAKSHPRLAHIEIVFDTTCSELVERSPLPEDDIPRMVGLWMAAETQAEINMRHVEAAAASAQTPPRPPRSVPLDRELFEATVERLLELRPWLSPSQAAAVVEAWIGARRLEPDPLFVPSTWEREVELQEARLAAAGAD